MLIVLPKPQAARARKALARLEGLPIRGVTYGTEDRVDLSTPGPGWTIEAVADADDGTTACIELPDYLQKWCGKTVKIAGTDITLPTLAQLKDESALPQTLKDVRKAKRSL